MKNASNDDVLPIVSGQGHHADRLKHHLELRLLVVLQHHPLRALLGDHALVVGQVEGRRLHAAIGVARREHRVDDPDRRHRAQLGIAVLRIDRQVVLDVLQLGPEPRQLLRLGIVAERDEGLERRLVVEPLVFVGLVRTDGRLDAGVEAHPGDVAVVVVVAEQRGRALLEISS